jgi:hypothetical protein
MSNQTSDNVPELIALAVGQYEIGQVPHDGLGGCVHKIQGAPIIGLDEFVFGRQSVLGCPVSNE